MYGNSAKTRRASRPFQLPIQFDLESQTHLRLQKDKSISYPPSVFPAHTPPVSRDSSTHWKRVSSVDHPVPAMSTLEKVRGQVHATFTLFKRVALAIYRQMRSVQGTRVRTNYLLTTSSGRTCVQMPTNASKAPLASGEGISEERLPSWS